MSDKWLGTIWVCECCMLTEANGECCSQEHGTDDYPMPLSRWEGYNLTLGMLASEHADDCLMRNYPDVPGDYECGCETDSFSWSTCEGCGCALGGARYAMTLWQPRKGS